MAMHPINEMMDTTISQIRQMADTDTIVGDPVYDKHGTTIIPVSKVSYGFASGGSDFPSKTNKELFGGGGGAGISITPIAFLVITHDGVKLMQINSADSTADKALYLIPEMVDKISSAISKKKKNSKSEKEAKVESEENTDAV